MTLTDERVLLASGGVGSEPDPSAPQPGGDIDQPDPQPGGDTGVTGTTDDPGDLDGTRGGPGADWD